MFPEIKPTKNTPVQNVLAAQKLLRGGRGVVKDLHKYKVCKKCFNSEIYPSGKALGIWGLTSRRQMSVNVSDTGFGHENEFFF